jgi:uncharacterized protein (DUF1697 family)
MARYVALLRAVNVGGTGRLRMSDLATLCRAAGFVEVETYIASGNVVFTSASAAPEVTAALAVRLRAHVGRSVGVTVRTAAEMRAVLDGNPFPGAEPRRTYVIFLDARPPADALHQAVGRDGEEMRLGGREIYVQYPRGMGASKLRIPAAKSGTARNINTVARLAAMAARR